MGRAHDQSRHRCELKYVSVIFAVFASRTEAERAVNGLLAAKFGPEQIGIVLRDELATPQTRRKPRGPRCGLAQ
jgi:hypothetical protein